MIFQIEIYWLFIATTLLGLVNIYFLSELWRRSWTTYFKETLGKTRSIDSKGSISYFLAPVASTIIVLGSFGMLAMGRSPEASAEQVVLHGAAAPYAVAVEAELRQERELRMHTQQELHELREQYAISQRKAEQQQFDKDIEAGEEHMLERRRQLMKRQPEEDK